MNTLFGIKRNMTSTYDARGRRVAATIVEVTPNLVTQVKKADGSDGYNAIQLGLGSKKNVKKPQLGILKKAGTDKKLRFFREVRVKESNESKESKGVEVGKEINMEEVFAKGDAVKVRGISKGKGFQGGVRRHGFHGGPKTRGQSDRHRAPGSIGQGTTPGRVYKGKRMAGHMGVEMVSTRNLEIITVDKTNNLLTIKGAIPGYNGSLIQITKLGRIKGYTPPPEEKPDEEEAPEKESNESEESKVTEENQKSTESVEEKGNSTDVEATEDKENAS